MKTNFGIIEQSRSRSRSQSPRGKRNRSRSPARNTKNKNKNKGGRDRDVDMQTSLDNGIEEGDDEAMMAAMMGFGGFGSTKGKKVENNAQGGAKIEKKAMYRQYMYAPLFTFSLIGL